MLGVLYAVFLMRSVLYTFLLTETLATFMGIGVLGGIVWPRANRWGALASLVGALATNFMLYASPAAARSLGSERVSRRARRRHRRAGRGQPADASRAARKAEGVFRRLQTSSDGDEAVEPLLLGESVCGCGRSGDEAGAPTARISPDSCSDG